jgi:hypothetical protein
MNNFYIYKYIKKNNKIKIQTIKNKKNKINKNGKKINLIKYNFL